MCVIVGTKISTQNNNSFVYLFVLIIDYKEYALIYWTVLMWNVPGVELCECETSADLQ